MYMLSRAKNQLFSMDFITIIRYDTIEEFNVDSKAEYMYTA